MKNRKYYDAIIGKITPGLTRATARILSHHEGEENTISREELAKQLSALGHAKDLSPVTFDRKMRASIAELRKAGWLICSSSGDHGYHLAKNRQEYDAFALAEYRSKIADMSETLAAMDVAAEQEFGRPVPAMQGSLL